MQDSKWNGNGEGKGRRRGRDKGMEKGERPKGMANCRAYIKDKTMAVSQR